MHAIRKPLPLAHPPQASETSARATQSPEHRASATSGTYFRAVRSTQSEAAALARGETLIDCAKVEGLRFEVEVGVWRGDSAGVARRIIADAESVTDTE
jgi:anti-sigma28 factor (negative regulator of flagellin synthesis)